MSYLGQVELKSSDIRRVDVTSSTSATHTLTWVPVNEQSLFVTINGVKQQEDAYSVSGAILTLTDALVSTDKMEVIGIQDIGVGMVPADGVVKNVHINDSAAIALSKLATDPSNASNLASGTVPTARLGSGSASSSTILYGDNTWAAPPAEYNDAGLQDDIALLGFKVASNGSLAKYNLVDQTVDDFQDTSGVDASSSTNEIRDSSGKYYSGVVDASTTAFTSNGTWTVPGGVTTVGILVIAGGGAGGYASPGGGRGGAGGAGGLITIAADTWNVTGSATYAVTIGSGGAIGSPGATGVNTTVVGDTKTLTALGGGGGGQGDGTNNATDGGSGGSGWYSGYPGKASTQPVNTTDGVNTYNTTGKGNAGGTSGSGGPYGGGGGGAGGAGKAYDDGSNPAEGGAGLDLTSQWGTTYGASGIFAGGGSGSDYNANSSFPATGGGGVGNNTANNSGGNTATANTGGGGGAGGDGGSGLVLVGVSASYNNVTLVSTTTAAQAAPTKGDIVLTYTNGAGTTTLDTDLTAEISADGGSTWTALALGSEGSTGSHNIATSHDVTISSTITAPYNMAYRIKTLNQAASKTTRIQAVSLGWS